MFESRFECPPHFVCHILNSTSMNELRAISPLFMEPINWDFICAQFWLWNIFWRLPRNIWLRLRLKQLMQSRWWQRSLTLSLSCHQTTGNWSTVIHCYSSPRWDLSCLLNQPFYFAWKHWNILQMNYFDNNLGKGGGRWRDLSNWSI